MRLLADDLDGLDAPLRREPRRPRRRGRPFPWFRAGLLSAAAVLGLAYVARAPQPASPDPVEVPLAPLIAPPPAWQVVEGAAPLYAVEGIEPASFGLEVRRHVRGAREDTLAFGSFGEAGYGRLRATVGAGEPETAGFYVDIVRHAARAGVSVVRSAQAEPLSTKFGPAEVAAVTLAGASHVAGASEEACLSFRILRPEAGFALRGWVCGSAAGPPAEAQVACLIDRLGLAARGEPTLSALFAEAERRRIPGCAPAPPVRSAAPEAGPAGRDHAGHPARPARPARPRR